MKLGISGYTIVRNAVKGDYCIRECISSLLPVCDEVVVSDCESTDGTREILDEWSRKESKLRIVSHPWANPIGDPKWFTDWINRTREHLSYSHQLMLDADEVLDDEASVAVIDAFNGGYSLMFKRLNFWRDAQTVPPSGEGGLGVGDYVARFGDTRYWMPSDEPHPEGEPTIRATSKLHPSARIFHYGFLRHDAGFKSKAKECLRIWFNTQDARIEKAISESKHWMTYFDIKRSPMKFLEPHPLCAHQWLRDRGFNPTP